jgi:hypothetical protein
MLNRVFQGLPLLSSTLKVRNVTACITSNKVVESMTSARGYRKTLGRIPKNQGIPIESDRAGTGNYVHILTKMVIKRLTLLLMVYSTWSHPSHSYSYGCFVPQATRSQG